MGINRTSIALGAGLLFTLGMLVGQQANGPAFLGKYLRPAPVKPIQLALIEANLQIIRSRADYSNGIAMPSVAYDGNCRCFNGWAAISTSLSKGPIDKVREALLFCVIDTYVALRSSVPELPEDPKNTQRLFSMKFVQILPEGNQTFAEFKDGELILR